MGEMATLLHNTVLTIPGCWDVGYMIDAAAGCVMSPTDTVSALPQQAYTQDATQHLAFGQSGPQT